MRQRLPSREDNDLIFREEVGERGGEVFGFTGGGGDSEHGAAGCGGVGVAGVGGDRGDNERADGGGPGQIDLVGRGTTVTGESGGGGKAGVGEGGVQQTDEVHDGHSQICRSGFRAS